MEHSTGKSMKGAHSVPKHTKKAAPKPEKQERQKGGSRAPLVVGIAGGVLAALLVLLGGFTYLYPNMFPGVRAGSIPVGGMSREKAAQAIESESGTLYDGAEVAVTIYEKTYSIPVDDVLSGLDTAQSAANAYEVGRKGNPFSRMFQVVRALFGGGEAQLAATVDEDGLDKALEEISAEALTPPVEPTWDLAATTMTLYAGKPGVQFDRQAVRDTLTEKIRLMDFEPYEVTTDLTETPAIDIDKIAEQLLGEMSNAIVDKADGTTIIPEKNGVQFDIEEARRIIGDGSAESYTIPITLTPAKVTAADLKEKLFRDTLARTTTELNEGNVSRTNNVRLASAAINGTILNPGEEFSYNGVVGERTQDRGYKFAGAYSGGQVVDEVGGGVCQPSSTLYMAVLRADLEVTERHNHSFTVSYTPLGEDATVSWGGPDFRFKNNTDYPIKILAEQTDGLMIMTLVGTKTSDKTVETRTEVLSTYSPQTVEKPDNSMKAGETRVDQGGITGYATRTYKQITENGKTTEVLANSSNYSKRDRIVYVGTIQPATPTPSPEPPEGGTSEPGGEPEPDTPAPPEETGGEDAGVEE